MSVLLADLPDDVLLKVASHLDPEDLADYLSSSRRLNDLGQEKTLWLGHLQHTIRRARRHPTAYFPDESLQKLPQSHLKLLVLRAARVFRNLQSATPTLARVLRLDVHPNARAILVPGTCILVVSSPDGRVLCWDLQAKRLAKTSVGRSARFYRHGLLFFKNPCAVVSSGRVVFGAVIHASNTIRHLAAVLIDVLPGSPSVVSFGLRVSSPFPECVTLTNGIGTATTSFVHPELMGVCGQNAMYTWNLAPKSALHKIEVDLQSQKLEYSVSTRWVYHAPRRILFQLKKTSNEELKLDYHLLDSPAAPRKIGIPYDSVHFPNLVEKPSDFCGWSGSTWAREVLVQPVSGVAAVASQSAFRQARRLNPASSISIFNTQEDPRFPDSFASFVNFFLAYSDPPQTYELLATPTGLDLTPTVSCTIPDIWDPNIVPGHSGRVVFVEGKTHVGERRVVGIASLRADDQGADWRELKYDGAYGAFPTGEMGVDDALGLVVVEEERGVVWVFSYAG
ncbi:hypothetical protein MKEN_01383600 [Mycena kentingensis (nom. inval.)]|nr:hypothetical protein MKEN_01383600 [Mycena kentingensis (nom. inval.)]